MLKNITTQDLSYIALWIIGTATFTTLLLAFIQAIFPVHNIDNEYLTGKITKAQYCDVKYSPNADSKANCLK
jgi:hypothetical protein